MSSLARSSCFGQLGRRAALAALAWAALCAHSPYRQWDTFRKSRLIVLADAKDERSQQVAQALAARIEAALPDSRATWARAPGALELVNLLASHQADVILLTPRQAAQARAGAGRFQVIGEQALNLLAHDGNYLLLCLDEYPAAYAWQLAKALGPSALGYDGLPLHPGVAAFIEGKDPPADAHRHEENAAAPAKP